ncbi:MAG: nucleotidyltransferase domain-containing protein [Candidatus Hodarchaeaceae archaeon]|nr:nucleotidyltransferase domain-containing protein [Candidatus Hodarchaeaceae archaeon]
MDEETRAKIGGAVETIKKLDREGRVQFIILYGSLARGKHDKLSDIDIAIGHAGDRRQRFDFRVDVLGKLGDEFDVQIFQDLPLYVRVEVLRGKALYVRDMKASSELALETIRDFELFEPRFLDYIYR